VLYDDHHGTHLFTIEALARGVPVNGLASAASLRQTLVVYAPA
jgi:hypothetical protein